MFTIHSNMAHLYGVCCRQLCLFCLSHRSDLGSMGSSQVVLLARSSLQSRKLCCLVTSLAVRGCPFGGSKMSLGDTSAPHKAHKPLLQTPSNPGCCLDWGDPTPWGGGVDQLDRNGFMPLAGATMGQWWVRTGYAAQIDGQRN